MSSGRRSTRIMCATFRACGYFRPKRCGCGEWPEMPDGGRGLPSPKRKRRQNHSSCTASSGRLDLPAFLVPNSVTELHELAQLIALAGWAPESYRDLDGNYVQQKIEMAIVHGLSVGFGPVAAVQ